MTFEPIFPASRSRVTQYSFSDSRNFRLVAGYVVRWQPYHKGEEVVVHLRMDCPDCGYPLVVPVKGAYADSAQGPSLRQLIQCPGHWHSVDSITGLLREDGGVTRCGWVGVLRDGRLHRPGCGHANFVSSAHTFGICGKSCDTDFGLDNSTLALVPESGAEDHKDKDKDKDA